MSNIYLLLLFMTAILNSKKTLAAFMYAQSSPLPTTVKRFAHESDLESK